MRWTIIKKGSKSRKVWIPNKSEKLELRKIKKKLDWLYFSLGIPDSVHGFIYGRNCRTNAERHCGYKYTISMDLKDFFDHVKSVHLSVVPYNILNKCLVNGAARQGLSTSPILSNIALIAFDKWAEKLPVAYTRYADDITISGNELDQLKTCQKEIVEQLTCLGFKINHKKTKLQTSKNRRIITGLSVDNDVRSSRKTRRKLRAAIHQGNKNSEQGIKEWIKCKRPMEVHWTVSGSWEYPIVQANFKGFKSGRKRPTTTFKGSRASFKRYLIWRMSNG